jgi:antitoxin VapB
VNRPGPAVRLRTPFARADHGPAVAQGRADARPAPLPSASLWDILRPAEGYTMPLYIKDSDVAEMAEALRKLTSARSKTEAVREALKRALEAATKQPSRAQGLREAVAIAQRIGPFDPDFDQKRFSDDVWDA